MVDSTVTLPDDAGNTGKEVLTKLVADKHLQVVVLADDAGDSVAVTAGRMQVDDQHDQPLTDAELRATPIPISGTVTANTGLSQAVTDAQLRAAPIIIEGAETDGAATPVGKAMLIAGITPAGVVQYIETNASGHVHIADGGSSITVDATALPLPDGAATTAAQATGNNTLEAIRVLQVSIETLIDTLGIFCSVMENQLPRLDSSNRSVVNNSEVTQPVSGTVTANIGTGTLALLTNITSIGGQQIPYIAQDVPLHLYDKIVVS